MLGACRLHKSLSVILWLPRITSETLFLVPESKHSLNDSVVYTISLMTASLTVPCYPLKQHTNMYDKHSNVSISFQNFKIIFHFA